MWTETAEGQQLIGEVSRDLVTQVAPEEMEMFDDLLQDYFQYPTPPDAGDDPLGFGGDVLVVVTPVVTAVVGAVVTFLWNEIVKTAKEEGSAFIAEKVKAFFHPPKETQADSSGLTRAQLQHIKEIVQKGAVRRGMRAKKAEDLALLVVAKIALNK